MAANLANCFRLRTGIVSAMVRYPFGDLIAERVRLIGITPFYKYFDHNGVIGPNMATIYSDRGFGVRAPVVFYNRANEAGAQLKPGDFDWGEIFSQGVYAGSTAVAYLQRSLRRQVSLLSKACKLRKLQAL